jgi:GT2 family glycosyltransferase
MSQHVKLISTSEAESMESRAVRAIKVAEVELSQPFQAITDLERYARLQVLVKWHGLPVGYVVMPVVQGRCRRKALLTAILEEHGYAIFLHLIEDAIAQGVFTEELALEDLVTTPHPAFRGPFPLITVAVCTRDRTDDLRICLASLARLQYPALDVLVVDNAPTSDATERLVRTHHPQVRYVKEPRPGLNWARNRAILEAHGEIIAYADDDVVVDANWTMALARVFSENPNVMAVTGLVAPHSLDTEAEILFERYGGFGQGFMRRYYHGGMQHHHGAGKFGTGANMAYRRQVFQKIGLFDPALDVGTVTNGGGDLEMFFRVLQEGHTLLYEPGALVYHRHRRDRDLLKTQLTNHGIGCFSFMVRSALTYKRERRGFLKMALWWWRWILRRGAEALCRPHHFPPDMIRAEMKGALLGLTRYFRARRHARQIAEKFGALSLPESPSTHPSGNGHPNGHPNGHCRNKRKSSERVVAVRALELSLPLPVLEDVTRYDVVRVLVFWKDRIFGSVDIINDHQPISAARLRHEIVQCLGLALLDPESQKSSHAIWAHAMTALRERFEGATVEEETTESCSLALSGSVSVVVATYDRPEDLRGCLHSLTSQETSRHVEIIVVDNHPASGITPPVVAEFPGVMLVTESRQGLSYARNAGIIASHGEIVVSTDDDVRMPADWLEKLVAPFAQPEVMVVTGNILPLELETRAQQLFEEYGGLGRGFRSLSADRNWFAGFRRAVPTWNLGGTANAAFRASIFSHSEIGLLDEALGAGTPTGCSEDTYLFYKVLKAGYSIAYEPTAYVWHRHRREIRQLARQIYSYSKGHVAYHLTTLLRDHDLRGLVRLVLELPMVHARRIRARLHRWGEYPLWLIAVEMAGHIAGPWALWRSRRRVRREGRSSQYVPRPLQTDPLGVPIGKPSVDVPIADATGELEHVV